MQLLLVRHAEPVRIVDADGPADPPLHERGFRQAAELARHLADERLDAVWSSPLQRARQTAAPLGEAHGLEVMIDEELAEWDRAATSYIPVEELKATKDERWVAMTEGRLEDYSVDPLEFQAAVVAAMDRVIAAHPGQTVAVVCHGGVINAYVGKILGIRRPLWFEPVYASIHRVTASRTGVRSLFTLNEHAHVRDHLGQPA
ncbi:MAG TPA: histidine phosphatase family protein [Acidimicrobiales bacterium]|nr:histidine phosphatase family protein [Acidimicrobiales bacterium]